MNTIGILKDTIMYAKGFDKVALKDTKGILTEANNHKWVKNFSTGKTNIEMQVFPSGTIVQDVFERNSIRKQKNIIKHDKTGINVLKDFGNTEGSFNISSVHNFKNNGKIIPYEPVYYPHVYGETLALRSVKEVKDKTSKNLESVKTKTKNRRERFIADFNNQFYRKTIKGKDGAISKYVIDKESGKIVRFFRKNKKGEVLNGRILYSKPLYKKVNVVSPQAFVHKETTYGPKGRSINKTTITLDGYAKNDNYMVSKKGELYYTNYPSEREQYINHMLNNGIK